MRTLTVHYVPACPFSAGAVAFLLLRGADFEAVNLDENPEERQRIEEALGGRRLETPTFEVDGALHVAPTLTELGFLLEDWDLPRDAAPWEQLQVEPS
jgi:hypothetical protein